MHLFGINSVSTDQTLIHPFFVQLGKGTLDLGEKRYQLGLSHYPLTGLLGTDLISEVLKNDKATFVPAVVPAQDPDPYVSDESILKIEARLGIAPQVRLDSFSEYP